MDRMVRYSDMKEFVEKLQSFAESDELEITLKQAGYSEENRWKKLGNLFEGKVEKSGLNEAVETLRARARVLDSVLERLFNYELLEKSLLLGKDYLGQEEGGDWKTQQPKALLEGGNSQDAAPPKNKTSSLILPGTDFFIERRLAA
jgi:hypothetical protein